MKSVTCECLARGSGHSIGGTARGLPLPWGPAPRYCVDTTATIYKPDLWLKGTYTLEECKDRPRGIAAAAATQLAISALRFLLLSFFLLRPARMMWVIASGSGSAESSRSLVTLGLAWPALLVRLAARGDLDIS